MTRRTCTKPRWHAGAIAALALASLTSSCTGERLGPPPVGVGLTTAADVTAGLVEHHRYHHHGGITLLVAMSVDTLDLSPEQQPAIERIRAALHTAMLAGRGVDDSLLKTLADGVAAGRVDRASVDAALANIGEESAAVYAASVDALNELHRVLTPSQRAALFDKVGWHWTIWRSANGESSRDNDWVATITDNLRLTTDQTEQVHAGFQARRHGAAALDPNEIAASLQALSEAFQKTDFDARRITAASLANRHMATWGAAQLAYLVEAAVPVLDAEQRASLKRTLQEHASHATAAERAW